MAITVATQKIWHKAYEHALKEITSLRNHCDFKYERDAKNADTVYILNAVRPTVRTYVPGTAITRDAVDATRQALVLDQFRYFNIEMDDVYKAQTVPGALEASAQEGAQALALEGDNYVASIIKAGAEAVTNPLMSTTRITPTKANSIDTVEEAFAMLYAKNNRPNDSYWLEVSPSFYKFVRPNMIEVLTNNVELAKNGAVGKYANAYVGIDNSLPTTTVGSGSTPDTVYNVLRTTHAIAFAEQIKETEAYRVQDGFSDAIKSLYVFGAKIVRPDEIVVIPTAI
jgi:hypothetical protein